MALRLSFLLFSDLLFAEIFVFCICVSQNI